jgi:hypothetical protein
MVITVNTWHRSDEIVAAVCGIGLEPSHPSEHAAPVVFDMQVPMVLASRAERRAA